MKRIRIGKDIDVTWTILTDGQATALDLTRLSVVLVSPNGIRTTMDATCTENVLSFHVGHDLETALGVYRLELWQDLDTTAQTAVDKLKAFQLVPYTTMEGDEDDSNINTSTSVTLDASTIATGGAIVADVNNYYTKSEVIELFDEILQPNVTGTNLIFS